MASTRSVLRLYKNILRTQQYALPPKHRELGDQYVRSEFRAHKDATPEQARTFMEEWESYLELLQYEGPVGRPLSQDEAASLNDEQREQLLRLKQQTAASDGNMVGDIGKHQ